MDYEQMNYKKWLIVVLLNLLLLAGCGEEPKWKTMYNECKAKVDASLTEVKKDKNTEAMGEMADSMGIAACDIIKKTCEGNEEGFTCRALVGNDSEQENQ